MAIRKIMVYGKEDILLKKAKPVTKFDEKLHTLLDDMAETMYASEGVGLAAPQVAVTRRVVVIDIGEGLVELINPEILETSGECKDAEGCLSVPGETYLVTRPTYAKVKAFDRNGNEFIIEGRDFMARALCHEIDHLDGIIYVQRVEDKVADRLFLQQQ